MGDVLEVSFSSSHMLWDTSTTVLVALLAVLVSWVVIRRLSTLDLLTIPTPWGSPLIGLGHLLMMALHVSNGHEQFLKWHEKYGSIVRLRLLHRDVVIVADPKVAAELLQKGPNECPRRTPEYTTFNAAHGMSGYGAILTEQNEERWRAIRKAIMPAYKLTAVRELFPVIVDCYAHVCERINSGAALRHPSSSSSSSNDGRRQAPEVLIDEEIFVATIQLLTVGFLHMPQEALFDVHKTAADCGALVAITNTFVTQPWKKWLYLGIPGLCRESRAFHAQRRHMMSVTHRIAKHIESVRSAPLRELSLASGLAGLREPATGELFSTEALQAEVFLEIVGQESVPWTMAWTLFLLIQHPDAEAAVLQELRAAGVPCNGDLAATKAALNMDMLRQLPYTTAVLHEAMRIFPAGVAATPRMTSKVTRVGPYRVPTGTIVFPCLYSILMYSGNWDDPHQFKPERWLDPSYATDPKTGFPRFVPFGIGPKACVAQQLAMVQCKVLLVLLLSCFSWKLAPRMGGTKGVLSQVVAALELRVAQGMWLSPEPRGAASAAATAAETH